MCKIDRFNKNKKNTLQSINYCAHRIHNYYIFLKKYKRVEAFMIFNVQTAI